MPHTGIRPHTGIGAHAGCVARRSSVGIFIQSRGGMRSTGLGRDTPARLINVRHAVAWLQRCSRAACLGRQPALAGSMSSTSGRAASWAWAVAGVVPGAISPVRPSLPACEGTRSTRHARRDRARSTSTGPVSRGLRRRPPHQRSSMARVPRQCEGGPARCRRAERAVPPQRGDIHRRIGSDGGKQAQRRGTGQNAN